MKKIILGMTVLFFGIAINSYADDDLTDHLQRQYEYHYCGSTLMDSWGIDRDNGCPEQERCYQRSADAVCRYYRTWRGLQYVGFSHYQYNWVPAHCAELNSAGVLSCKK